MPADSQPTRDEDILQRIVEGTTGEAGTRFFCALTKNLAECLGTYAAWVTDWMPESRRLRILAFWMQGSWREPFEYDVTDTPCETVVEQLCPVHIPENILEVYPRDKDARFGRAVSYLGVALRNASGSVLGHLAVLDDKPMPANPRALALFQIFAGRATAELEKLRAERELSVAQGYGEILGQSEALRLVLQDVVQVAPTDATVLILGETGTGKELLARAIHSRSARRERPLVKVNCSAIPAALMESEFFGHEKGAFTGATGRREGRFALADSGTIFLDEIGDLSLDLQAKLLRVLQEGEFEPVGSSITRKVNVRVLAATHRDLGREAHEGRFRQDLYYRLNVFPLTLPPLRERGDDLVLLAEQFARRAASRLGRTIGPFSASDSRRLRGYDWPGNVRELQNVIERAVIVSRDGRLDLDRALPQSPSVERPSVSGPVAAKDILTEAEVRQLEIQNLQRALDRCNGRVAGKGGAAQLLGMSPSTLTSRLKALGIRRARE